ncbi:glycosyltransferase family 2 protein [Rothia nasimurium]|uniref:glycosyltransferase family 2 protein n=1 Tax=Rothia nasimurium TaxID=85336 RepID=UPI001F469F46|nr:glycosyltransferase [Rothia nasimurium]
MDIPPDISVVIPCKNGGDYLLTQLEHLSQQINPPSFEVIISDNGSTDGAIDKVFTTYSDKIRIKKVDSSNNTGSSHARNIGVHHSQGKYIAFCDADDYVDPCWLHEIYEAFKLLNVDIVAGGLIHTGLNSTEVIEAYGINITYSPAFPRFTSSENLAYFAGFLPSVAGCNFAVRKELYLSVGGMSSEYPHGSEETDFIWRAQLAGGQIASANYALVNYRLRSSFRKIFNQQFNYQKTRVKLWLQYKDRGMTGPSIKYSLISIISELPQLRKPEKRLRSAYILGGNCGAIYGSIFYRIITPLFKK